MPGRDDGGDEPAGLLRRLHQRPAQRVLPRPVERGGRLQGDPWGHRRAQGVVHPVGGDKQLQMHRWCVFERFVCSVCVSGVCANACACVSGCGWVGVRAHVWVVRASMNVCYAYVCVWWLAQRAEHFGVLPSLSVLERFGVRRAYPSALFLAKYCGNFLGPCQYRSQRNPFALAAPSSSATTNHQPIWTLPLNPLPLHRFGVSEPLRNRFPTFFFFF